MDCWELYLHPSQRYIVELPASYRLSVGGAAGTGKTVCAWYRTQHLAAQGHSVGFVCPNRKVFEVSRHMLKSLLRPGEKDCYFLIPKSSNDIVQLTEVVEHIVVDEGQELAPTWFADLGSALAEGNTGLTLFYDLNQLGGNIKPGDTSRLQKRFESWHSRLDSFPQLGRMGLSINYRNSKEIAEYWQEALAGFLPDHKSASIPLFGAGEVVVKTIHDRKEMGLQVARIVQALQKDYDDGEIGIILNSYVQKETASILGELRSFGIKTTNEVLDKRMILSASPRDVKGHERKAIVFCTPPIERSTRKWGKAIECVRCIDKGAGPVSGSPIAIGGWELLREFKPRRESGSEKGYSEIAALIERGDFKRAYRHCRESGYRLDSFQDSLTKMGRRMFYSRPGELVSLVQQVRD